MNNILGNLVDNTVQCYGCPVFDRLFQIVSSAAASVYNRMAFIMAVIFCILLAFYILNAVWQNTKKDSPDLWYQKSVRSVVINSLVALTFLFMGVGLPRFITRITFEPTAEIATIYTQSILDTNTNIVNERVTYQPMQISDDGFFRPQLRDKIIVLMKTTITQFQSYMKLGIAVIDSAITWKALLGIGTFIQHFILFVVGVYLFYSFFRLFFRFCCYFADIIVEMAKFAFFFPLSLVLIPFDKAEHVPSWMSGLGKKVGTNQIKSLINAIVALGAAVITYMVIMVIIARFFSSPDNVNELISAINSGDVLDADLSDDNLEILTITSTIVLVYVINFLQSKIPDVTKMIMSVFNVTPENKLSEQLATDAENLVKDIMTPIKKAAKTVITGGEGTPGGAPSGTTK